MAEPRRLDLSDPDTLRRVWELQRAAYAVEAELIGFAGIPPHGPGVFALCDRLFLMPASCVSVQGEDAPVVAGVPAAGVGDVGVRPGRGGRGRRRLQDPYCRQRPVRASVANGDGAGAGLELAQAGVEYEDDRGARGGHRNPGSGGRDDGEASR
jgi:hypothetical protein